MSAAPITLEALVAAFALPPGEKPRRVPKATLADNVPTAADRKLVDGTLARLEWIAAINPATTGIAAGTADGLLIDTVNVLIAQTRGPMQARLAEIIHRAIPKPVILIHGDYASDAGAALSLAPKRAAERELDRVVTTSLIDTGPLTAADGPLLSELALSRLPGRDLAALYAGLVERLDARTAAMKAFRVFRLAISPTEQHRWRDALGCCAAIEADILTLAAAARKEKSLPKRVELGEEIRRLKSMLDGAVELLK